MLDLIHERAAFRLRGHGKHVAFDVELPAVVEAAQSAFFIAPQDERRTAMRAQFVKQAKLAVRVTKRNQAIAQDFDQDGLAVRLCHLLDQTDRRPMLAHEFAHRRIG